MHGVGGGHQPVNLTPTINDVKTPETNKSEGDFRGFKVTTTKTFKSFLSSLLSRFSSTPGKTSIRDRHAQKYKPTQQHGPTISDQQTTEKSVEQPAKQANPATIKRRFDRLCTNLERMQTFKNDLQNLERGTDEFRMCSLGLQRAKAKFNAAVDSFNQSVGADQQIDASDLEMTMANKQSPEFAEDAAKYKQMNIPAFVENTESVEQPIDLALKNPDTEKKFTNLCDTLKQMQKCKNELQDLSHRSNAHIASESDIHVAKANFKQAVESFNSVVGDDLKVDAFDLEMAMANKDAPEFAENIARFQQMKIPSFMPKN
ncbi:hypothetical protein [Endozoicomonas sp. GU-1]|uniref:hypothetical protein n=1 Tax=Endozoicomonas sp. GU-1 TaxID=3009078 RepID=UPI0022B2F3A9|nr:hypothetical protein [Endozoicomonas sp. GU-1]WBA80559.1 hypothetical protein O2T12_19835 [Endozoicomonas sp. GU-1]WBA88127.1 hypothetical protein O3276_09045 [Endozoicomonas sp. GU-1]